MVLGSNYIGAYFNKKKWKKTWASLNDSQSEDVFYVMPPALCFCDSGMKGEMIS